jgi:hydroxymethylglutaryl-CoA synthase
MLIGPNAPIVFDQGLRGVHMEHAYDFYKPNLDSEYPVVDGKLSVDCYLRSVDNCYNRYAEKYTLVHKGSKFDINAADYVVFHAPYNKLVQKSLARMVYNDMLRDSENPKYAPIVQFKELGLGEKSYANPTMEKAVAEFAKNVYQQKVVPGTILPKQVGNTYTASLYNGLVSLVAEIGDGLVGKRVFLFSYGSGLASTLFSFSVKTSIKHIVAKIDLKNKLASRQQVVPEQFVKTLQLRETRHGAKDYTPSDAIDTLFPGTYYLTKIDGKLRRFYARKPLLPSAL